MSRRGWRRGRPRIWLPVLLALVWTLGLATTAIGAFSWTGTWSTNFGEMRLTETVDPDSGVRTITGPYDYVIAGRIEGTATGDVLTGTWIESVPTNGTGVGPLVFTMSQDGRGFTGLWNNQGLQPTLPWNGTRVTVRPPPLSPATVPKPRVSPPIGPKRARIKALLGWAPSNRPLPIPFTARQIPRPLTPAGGTIQRCARGPRGLLLVFRYAGIPEGRPIGWTWTLNGRRLAAGGGTIGGQNLYQVWLGYRNQSAPSGVYTVSIRLGNRFFGSASVRRAC